MEQKQPDMMDLEQFMASAELDAKEDEQTNADSNFYFLDSELTYAKESIPYPDTHPYSVSSDYDEISIISYEKKRNQPYWDKIKTLTEYCDCDNLYHGHVRINNSDFFIMDDSFLGSMSLDNDSTLVNADDESYSHEIKVWRNFEKDSNSEFSRNITLSGRNVDDVEIIFDNGSSEFSNITDNYLRKALLRNKSKSDIGSIIQTIQKKQNDIRSLSKNNSFIVQGCAGSGKTMILLHRLRYLLYNKYISQDEYVLLVPSNGFKNFIERLAVEFRIAKDNIIPYKEYYQRACNTKAPLGDTDINELVFPEEYLATVYSADFIEQCYKKLFDSFSEQIEILIELCEKQLKEIMFSENFIIEQEIEKLENSVVTEAQNIISPLKSLVDSSSVKNIDDISSILNKLDEIYKNQKEKYDSAAAKYKEIVIAPDDKRILENQVLSQLAEKIRNEEEATKKASVFTVAAHRNKLKHLKEDYEKEKTAIVSTLIAEEKAIQEKEVAALSFVCEGITVSFVENTISKLKTKYDNAVERIQNAECKFESVEDDILKKYPEEKNSVNKLIEFSGELSSYADDLVEELSPCYELLFDKMKRGKEILDGLFKGSYRKEDERIKDKLTFFSQASDNKIYNTINMSLLNICKKEIRSAFNIEICNQYRHYWYLSLYCKYLTHPIKNDTKKYIFLDEAQDLNISEIELINKLNISRVKSSLSNDEINPVMNLFGDTKQMITKHGISDWKLLSCLIPKVYDLNENFRNTNQIIEYCNKNLSTKMESVGVDLRGQRISRPLRRSQRISLGFG